MYLDACVMAYLSTGDEEQKQRALYMVDVLEEVQNAIGTGYLAAFPSVIFDYLESLQYVLCPRAPTFINNEYHFFSGLTRCGRPII